MESLRPMELRVARLLCYGLAYKEVAHRLNISPKTVGCHVTHIYEKLDIGKVVQLCVVLTRQGQINYLNPADDPTALKSTNSIA